MFRGVGIVLIWALFCPKIIVAASNHLVINSFRVAGATSTTDEFVEIYNPTLEKINITGWQLAKKTATGKKYNLVTSFPAAYVSPGESLLIGHKESTTAVDIYYDTDYSISEDNTILLFSDAGQSIVDRVGFGKATDFEGSPMGSVGKETWERAGGSDSDNNLSDFRKRLPEARDYSGICISELMPRPKDGDEWIEIYNSEMTKDISGLVIADKSGSTKKFTVPEGTVIKEGEYLVFYKKDTGITLNDDIDGVILIDGTGQVFDDSTNFAKAPAGSSFASDGQMWHWSSIPTPGRANVIDLSSTAVISSKKRASSTGANSSQKGKLPTTAVLGSQSASGDNIFEERKNQGNPKDQLLGYILIGVALIGGLLYTLSVNKEKLIAVFNEERSGYTKTWRRVWEKIKRR